jgi:hypothetical protein
MRAKPGQIKPSKIAWICLVLFVRIGTFQRVTAEKIKNSFLPSLRLSPGKTLARSDTWERYSTNSDFRKKLRKEIAPALFAPPIRPTRGTRASSRGADDCHQALFALYPLRRAQVGPVAQWLEPAAHNGLVAGSSPARPTIVSQGIAGFRIVPKEGYATVYVNHYRAEWTFCPALVWRDFRRRRRAPATCGNRREGCRRMSFAPHRRRPLHVAC